jgi:ribonuclease HI
MAKTGRPSGFPRALWALIADEEQQCRTRERWATATKNEPTAYAIASTVTGRSIEELRAQATGRQGAKPAAQPVHINCDGLCEPVNPGGTATYGFVARRWGELLVENCGVVAKGPSATNNLAEYTAVTKALEWAAQHLEPGQDIVVRTDSQLVVNQLNGVWEVRSQKIWPLHQQAKLALAQLRRSHQVKLDWVPREQNSEADRLTRVAYARADKDGTAARAERAAKLVATVVPTEDEGRFLVLSSTKLGHYVVNLEHKTCTCPDFANRQAECKHILATEMFVEAQHV